MNTKKFICMLLATIIMMFSTISVSAIETNSTQQVQLSYIYEGNYMIYIPMEVNVGNSISVSAGEVNILDNKKIVVSVGNFDSDSRIVLTNNDTGDNVYTVLKDTNYNQITMDNNVIGEFTNDEHSGKNIYTEVYFTDSVKAGTYTGYMDFYIEVTNK